jgi:hypothetical protein
VGEGVRVVVGDGETEIEAVSVAEDVVEGVGVTRAVGDGVMLSDVNVID